MYPGNQRCRRLEEGHAESIPAASGPKNRRLSALMSTATNESTQSEKERMMHTCMDYVTRVQVCQSLYCTDDDGFDDVNGKLSCRSGGAKGMNIGA